MDDLIAELRHRIGVLAEARVRTAVPLGAGAEADLLFESDTRTWLVLISDQPPGMVHVGQVRLLVELYRRQNPSRAEAAPPEGLIVAPAVSDRVRQLARTLDVDVAIMPLRYLAGQSKGPRAPLATDKSWRVILALVEHGSLGGVRELYEKSGVSLGWAHRVLKELEGHGAVTRERGVVRLADLTPILDAVAQERPMRKLRTAQVETGLDSWQGIPLLLRVTTGDVRPGETPGTVLCGRSAVMYHTNYGTRTDLCDVYTREPDALMKKFEGQKGGIKIHIYKPDREEAIFDAAEAKGNIWITSRGQTLLDLAGFGYGAREDALELVKVMRAA